MVNNKNLIDWCTIMLVVTILSACSMQQQALVPLDSPDKYGVTEFTLANNIKIIIKEDHRAPLAVTQFWYRVGSSDEHNGITGISHALEHMMFKGTPNYPRDKFIEIVKREGGKYNAFTGFDYTAYYEIFEKNRMSLSFELEADRMLNLTLATADFEKEIEVIKEERRLRTEDNPSSLVWEQLYATAFNISPYGRPVIGWLDDISNLRIAELEQWYKKWYSAANVFVLVAGDVEPERVRQLAIQYLEDLPVRPVPERKPRREPEQKGERRATVSAPGKKPFITMGYRVPNIFNTQQEWEPYALVMLSEVLSANSSARFPKNFVRGKKIAQNVNSYYDSHSLYDDLFVIRGTPLDHVTLKHLEQEIEKELDKLKEEPVSSEELQRIQIQIAAAQVYGRDSIHKQAHQMGVYEAIGAGWRTMHEVPQRLEAVTAEQIQAVAKKYLQKQQRTVVIFHPITVDIKPIESF